MPEGIRVVILSRNTPPAQLARLQANNLHQLVGWEDVRFTAEESGELLKAQGQKRTDKKTITLLQEKSEGWAAGLVLMTEAARTKGFDYRAVNELSREAVFNYFANEIFNAHRPQPNLFSRKPGLHILNSVSSR